MNDVHRTNDNEMDRILQALETVPSVAVPDDFAARVMARLPSRPQRRYVLRQTVQAEARVGRKLAFAALLILVAAMLALAPHTTGSPTWLLLQALLFAQLIALLTWMGITYKRLF